MKILPLLLLLSQNPHQVLVLLGTILAAMKQLKSQSYMHDCWLWLWVLGGWELHEIDMAL
jgi:hypothetical protein